MCNFVTRTTSFRVSYELLTGCLNSQALERFLQNDGRLEMITQGQDERKITSQTNVFQLRSFGTLSAVSISQFVSLDLSLDMC